MRPLGYKESAPPNIYFGYQVKTNVFSDEAHIIYGPRTSMNVALLQDCFSQIWQMLRFVILFKECKELKYLNICKIRHFQN